MNATAPIVEADPDPQVMAVQVVNRNDFTIVDMFDGVPYRFIPNKPVRVPVDAANHIFGWHPPYVDEDGNRHEVDQDVMRRHVQKRFGWNTPAMVKTGTNELFYQQLEMSPVAYRMVPVELDEDGNPVQSRSPRTNKMMQAADEAQARAAQA